MKRQLPQSNSQQELVRVVNLIYDAIESNGTASTTVVSRSSGVSGGGSVVQTGQSAPSWTYNVNPPFAVFETDGSGNLQVDADGYAKLRYIL